MSVMSMAPSVSKRALVGRYAHWDGSAVEGEIEIALTYRVDVDADAVTIVPSEKPIPLDADGAFRVELPVSTDSDMSPNPVAFVVREPGSSRPRTITIPAGAGDLDIRDAPETVIVPPELIGIALTGLRIGQVTTGAPGSLGAASITGAAPIPDLNLTIPQGLQGDRPTIVLGAVTTGAAGTAASATWTGVGTVVTPYSLSLTIPRGEVGPQGAQPIVQAGTATKLAPGGTPTVTITGSGTASSPYRLNVGLVTGDTGLKGDKGDKGDPGGIDLATSTGVLAPAHGGVGSVLVANTTAVAVAKNATAYTGVLKTITVSAGTAVLVEAITKITAVDFGAALARWAVEYRVGAGAWTPLTLTSDSAVSISGYAHDPTSAQRGVVPSDAASRSISFRIRVQQSDGVAVRLDLAQLHLSIYREQTAL